MEHDNADESQDLFQEADQHLEGLQDGQEEGDRQAEEGPAVEGPGQLGGGHAVEPVKEEHAEHLEQEDHRSRGKAVRCVIYLNSFQGQSCLRIFSCADPVDKLQRAVAIWLVNKPGVEVKDGKAINFKLLYKDPFEQNASVNSAYRELATEDDWDAALVDLQLVESLQQSQGASNLPPTVVKLELLVRAGNNPDLSFTAYASDGAPHPLASILPPGTGTILTIPASAPAPVAVAPGGALVPLKRGRGRPKGAKSRPKFADPASEAAWDPVKRQKIGELSTSQQHLMSLQQVYRMFAKRGQPETPDTLPRAGLLLERMGKGHIRNFCELKYQMHHVLKRDGEDLEQSRGADYVVSLQRMACPLCGRIFAANDTQFANLWGARKLGAENKHLDFHLKQDVSEVERLGAERIIQRLWDWKHNNGKMTVPGPPALAAPPRPSARPDFIMPASIIPSLQTEENDGSTGQLTREQETALAAGGCIWSHEVIKHLENMNPRVLKTIPAYEEPGNPRQLVYSHNMVGRAV